MNKTLSHVVGSVLLASLASNVAYAKVSEEEAAKLGKELTPFGGEKAGNKDGTIPEWSGKWLGAPDTVDYKGPGTKPPSPYADEKPLFTITAENVGEYKERLNEAQIAMFERYPKTWKMNIYPSHRDFDVNKRMAEKAKWNATHTELANGVESLENYTGGVAFPIPEGPEQVLWNTRANGCYASYHMVYDGYGVFANGDRSHEQIDYLQSDNFNNPDNPIPTTEEKVGDRTILTFSGRLAPPRDKGEWTAVQDPIDYQNDKRNAWTYSPGTRRVRKAPAVGYDNPTGPGGLQTIDDHKGFNGAFDRFTYKLIGKKELYIPYHNYDFNDPQFGDLDDRLTINHVNPKYVRWELHRVWEVEGDLAKGKRHAYKKRKWYADEDSWNPVLTQNYDGRDNLWRMGILLSDYQYDIECYSKHTQIFVDLPSGHYVTSFITLEQDAPDFTVPYKKKAYFTPSSLRKKAKR